MEFQCLSAIKSTHCQLDEIWQMCTIVTMTVKINRLLRAQATPPHSLSATEATALLRLHVNSVGCYTHPSIWTIPLVLAHLTAQSL